MDNILVGTDLLFTDLFYSTSNTIISLSLLLFIYTTLLRYFLPEVLEIFYQTYLHFKKVNVLLVISSSLFLLFPTLFIYLYSLSFETEDLWLPLYRGEEVTDHNTGISLLLSISVWVLLNPLIERRETRTTA